MNTAMKILALFVAVTTIACDDDPMQPIDPPMDGPACSHAPDIAADDPCCRVHRCLAAACSDACVMQPVCQDLSPGVVCPDQMCDGADCSECECSAAYECAAQYVDSFAGDQCEAHRYCRSEFPDCIDPRLDALGCDP